MDSGIISRRKWTVDSDSGKLGAVGSDSGQWTVRQWAVGNWPWAVGSRQLSVVSFQLPVVTCQLPVDSCQLPVASYQLSVVSCHLLVINRLLSIVSGQWIIFNFQLTVGQ